MMETSRDGMMDIQRLARCKKTYLMIFSTLLMMVSLMRMIQNQLFLNLRILRKTAHALTMLPSCSSTQICCWSTERTGGSCTAATPTPGPWRRWQTGYATEVPPSSWSGTLPVMCSEPTPALHGATQREDGSEMVNVSSSPSSQRWQCSTQL